MIPRATEDTITSILASELKKYGIKAEVFPSIRTPSGIRKPDIWCSNGGIYLIEAKYRERDLIDAIAKIQNDYMKWYDVLGINGAFAVLYPEELAKPLLPDNLKRIISKAKFKLIAMFPPRDSRKCFTVYEGTLSHITNILAEHILTPPEYVEPNTEYIIKALREVAEYITSSLKVLSGRELENFFGGKEVFENILQYEEKEYPIENLRLASAYLLVNQLLFYHVLSRWMPEKFPEIDADNIRKPVDLKKYFDKVLNINYRVIFSYDVVSWIPTGFTSHIKKVINVIKGIAPEKVGGDLLGTIFHDLIPLEVRKYVAAFYTNVLAAELLAWLSIDHHDAEVADLACGSGGLLVAAYRRKKYLLEKKRKFTASDHKRFVEKELLGIDVMPFAANIAACHLALQSLEYFTDKVNVAVWDSTELEPGRSIPSIAGLKFTVGGQTALDIFLKPEIKHKGVVSLTGDLSKEIKLSKYDVIIMNPPFTRQERIPKEYKRVLMERFKNYKEYLHGQLGYYGYFIFLADKFLKEGGRMALVLPATVLRVKSCEGIRRLLAEKYYVEHIVTTWQRSAFSESTRFREILLVAKKGKPKPDANTTITILKKLPKSLSEARKYAETIRNIYTNYEDDKITIRTYKYIKLQKDTRNWFKYIAFKDTSLLELFDELMQSHKLKPLSSICNLIRGLELRGGVVTKLIINTRKEKAIKTKDIWILIKKGKKIVFRHKTLNIRFEIPADVVMPTLRRAAWLKTIDVSQDLDYIIVKKFRNFDYFENIIGYKFSRELLGSIERDVRRRLGNVLIVWRFDVSAPGTCALAFYSSQPTAPVKMFWTTMLPDDYAKILTLYLNSTINLIQVLIQRVETRGAFIELSEYILQDSLVLDPKSLSLEERIRLLNLFEKIRGIKWPSILDQLRNKHKARVEIDKEILKSLGYEDNVDSLLSNLYDKLYNEIILLKEMMKERPII